MTTFTIIMAMQQNYHIITKTARTSKMKISSIIIIISFRAGIRTQ